MRVWLDGEGGAAARLDVRVRFDDPWLNFGEMLTIPPERFDEVFEVRPVTPKLVAAMIEQAQARGWSFMERGTTVSARWNDGVLQLPAADD